MLVSSGRTRFGSKGTERLDAEEMRRADLLLPVLSQSGTGIKKFIAADSSDDSSSDSDSDSDSSSESEPGSFSSLRLGDRRVLTVFPLSSFSSSSQEAQVFQQSRAVVNCCRICTIDVKLEEGFDQQQRFVPSSSFRSRTRRKLTPPFVFQTWTSYLPPFYESLDLLQLLLLLLRSRTSSIEKERVEKVRLVDLPSHCFFFS